ncbi:MAG TPA: hypothetical protein P5084_15150 [Paludibacter sp.]|nr:hypothetical protein [Paludibacter sp.]
MNNLTAALKGLNKICSYYSTLSGLPIKSLICPWASPTVIFI